MSLTGENPEEKFGDKTSDNEEGFETVEDGESDESVTQFITNTVCPEKKHFKNRKTYRRSHGGRLIVSLRHSKHRGQHTGKSKRRKHIKRKTCKNSLVKSQDRQEKPVEVPHWVNKCHLVEEAKAVPPEEENYDKYDSDEDADSLYFNRISLGCFQKYRDESGASTSYQRDECYRSPNILLTRTEEMTGKISEELELLELQQWGMSSMITSNKTTEGVNTSKDIRPDTL